MELNSPEYAIMYGIVHAVGPDRETVDQGGTVSMLGQELPTHGYFVGGVVEELIFERFVDIDGPEVIRFVDTNPSEFVGWWVDEETGKIHIDAVEWYERSERALYTARGRGEIAVWDVANSREIRV